jgi:hypothetical protein
MQGDFTMKTINGYKEVTPVELWLVLTVLVSFIIALLAAILI